MKSFKKYLTEDISTREHFYDKQHQKWMNTPYQNSSIAVGWLDGDENQTKRFQTLLGIGVQNGDSVLDLGCGLGHMVEHIKNVGLKVHYTGVDTNNFSIKQAKKFDYSTKEERYIHGSIDDIEEKYDWCLASGIFNVKFPKIKMLETVNKLISKANKGVAFNLLCGINNSLYESYIPEELVSHLKGNISIIKNYGIENDFTVYIRKNKK